MARIFAALAGLLLATLFFLGLTQPGPEAAPAVVAPPGVAAGP